MAQVRNDRFGNETMLIGCKPNKNGYPVGYMEIGGKLFKIEPSPSNKEGVDYWVKVTKINKQKQQRNGSKW